LGMAVVVTMLALGLSGFGEGIEDFIGGPGWAGLGCACPVQGAGAPPQAPLPRHR